MIRNLFCGQQKQRHYNDLIQSFLSMTGFRTVDRNLEFSEPFLSLGTPVPTETPPDIFFFILFVFLFQI